MAHACRLIANASEWQLHYSTFGPTENDLVLLNDNKTLMSVIRMDGDSGCGPTCEVSPARLTRSTITLSSTVRI